MPQSDVWQLGLLLLDLTESNRPAAHLHCLNSSQFVEELRQGVQDPRTVPGQKAQLAYAMQECRIAHTLIRCVVVLTCVVALCQLCHVFER